MDEVLDISMYIYPVDTTVIMKNLRRKVTQLEADISLNAEKGRIRNPETEHAIQDAEELRDDLQLGREKFFRFGLYVTLWADSLDELNFVQHKIENYFGSAMIFSKVATSQQEQGMNSTMPMATDQLMIRRNMNTSAISTSFPFTSADLTQEKGILYGVNLHNNGLVIFDRFTLENANLVVFAKSGAGKSFAVKLEAVRSMMMGSEIIIIDPENEYQKLCDAVGGSYVRLSLNSDVRINPFDLPKVIDSEDASDALRANLVTLHGLFRLMLGGTQSGPGGQTVAALSPNEEADLDEAWRGEGLATLLSVGGKSGFNALRTGGNLYQRESGNFFENKDKAWYFWTATQTMLQDSIPAAYVRLSDHFTTKVWRGTSRVANNYRPVLYSVRCVKDLK